MPLKIAAKVDRKDQDYYENQIKPLLNNSLIEFIGEISDLEKNEFLGNASALLFPINWSEPFGTRFDRGYGLCGSSGGISAGICSRNY